MKGIIILTIASFLISVIIVIIDHVTNKENKEEEYLKRLPGYNCGACGYAGCKGMSEAMLENVNNYKKCKPLRGDKLKIMEEYLGLNNNDKNAE